MGSHNRPSPVQRKASKSFNKFTASGSAALHKTTQDQSSHAFSTQAWNFLQLSQSICIEDFFFAFLLHNLISSLYKYSSTQWYIWYNGTSGAGSPETSGKLTPCKNATQIYSKDAIVLPHFKMLNLAYAYVVVHYFTLHTMWYFALFWCKAI